MKLPKKQTPQDFARVIAPSVVTPDQGCFAAIIGTALLLVSIGFWFIVYVRNADEFKPAKARQGPPPAQIEREREAARKARLNK